MELICDVNRVLSSTCGDREFTALHRRGLLKSQGRNVYKPCASILINNTVLTLVVGVLISSYHMLYKSLMAMVNPWTWNAD